MPNAILIKGQVLSGTGRLVPEQGELILDPATNTLKIGDGQTPGGVSPSGDGMP